MADELTPGQQEARNEIHDLIQRHVQLIGPAFDGNDELEPDERPADTVFLDGWVLMADWVDENGEGFLTRVTSRSLRSAHRAGLLHEGLYGFDD